MEAYAAILGMKHLLTPSEWRPDPDSRVGVEVMLYDDDLWRNLPPDTPARIRAAAKALDAARSPVTVRIVWRDGIATAEVVP